MNLNDTITIYSSYNSTMILTIDKISKCSWHKSICPKIGDDELYPIYHSKSMYEDLWFSFYYENKLMKNLVAIFLDDVESSHSLWCGGNEIWSLSKDWFDE